MKIIISYPPLKTQKGYPTLGQNRQFQYFREPTYIYPVVPATAATLLKKNGYDVLWNDCIAEGIDYEEYINLIQKENPDMIAFETKTPVIKQHWKIIDQIKNINPKIKIVLFGDHVTALSEESFQNSQVDYILTGGDYDFLLKNLCDVLEKRSSLLTTDYGLLEPGICYRDNDQIKNTDKFKLNHELDSLPFIDRDLTKWKLYAYRNGNYKCTPGTYIMSGRDCWWGNCTFCSWPTLYPNFRVRKVENVLDEIGMLIERFRIKEIMDDTGTFPVGNWLKRFCDGMIERGYNSKINIDCNMRFGALGFEDYKLMKEAGFRLLLFGLESANQETLNKINKNLTVTEIINSCRLARRAGLFPHITIMFGYPWETYEDALKTFKLGRWLLKKGYAYTVQATIVIPYPGTPLFRECIRQEKLYTLDWARYDMKEPIMKLGFPPSKLMELVRSIYSIVFNPEFLARKILSIRGWEDLRYFSRTIKKVFGHIFDFNSTQKAGTS